MSTFTPELEAGARASYWFVHEKLMDRYPTPDEWLLVKDRECQAFAAGLEAMPVRTNPEQLPGPHERRVEAISLYLWNNFLDPLVKLNVDPKVYRELSIGLIAADPATAELVTWQQQCDSVQQTNEELLKTLQECAEVLLDDQAAIDNLLSRLGGGS